MEAEKVQQTPPDPNSITQRKGAFIKAAHQYGQLYEWRKAQDQRFTEKRFRLEIWPETSILLKPLFS